MQLKRTVISLLFLLFYSVALPQESNGEKLFERDGYIFPYQLNNPDKTWKLPKELVEISGLSYLEKHRLACIQDEKGNIYIFNTKNEEIEKQIGFGEKGDYEGIEVVGNDAWVLKSNGTLYQIMDFPKDNNPKVHKYKTALSGRNNCEGLGYDSAGHNLLIACKGYPFTKNNERPDAGEYKAIFRFDLKTRQLHEAPVLLIALDSMKQYKNYNSMTSLGIELLAFFDATEGDVSFQPSGIAVHPQTGNIYVLASVGKVLAVFSGDGRMLALIHLKSKIHEQPEGICFSPGGTLYISNEGDDGKGMILRFNKNERK